MISVPLVHRRFKEYRIANLESIDDILKPVNKSAISRNIRSFLIDLVNLQVKKLDEVIPSLRFDEIFVGYLHSIIEAMRIPLTHQIKEKAHNHIEFKQKLENWFSEQGWAFTNMSHVADTCSRQYILLLIEAGDLFCSLFLRPVMMEDRPRDHGEHVGMPDHVGWAHVEHKVGPGQFPGDRFTPHSQPVVVDDRVHCAEPVIVIGRYEPT